MTREINIVEDTICLSAIEELDGLMEIEKSGYWYTWENHPIDGSCIKGSRLLGWDDPQEDLIYISKTDQPSERVILIEGGWGSEQVNLCKDTNREALKWFLRIVDSMDDGCDRKTVFDHYNISEEEYKEVMNND